MTKVTFIVNREYDKENLKFFLNYTSPSGQDSFAIAVQDYPELLKFREVENPEQQITEWVDKKYDDLGPELEKNCTDQERIWRVIEDRFFAKASELFDGHKWPRQEFTACLTLFSRYRYDKETGIFFVPRQNIRHGITGVCIHELLHFLFFDYCEKNFKGKLSDEKLWDLSEVLNVLIMQSEPFGTWTGQKVRAYPKHKHLHES